jgi:transposase
LIALLCEANAATHHARAAGFAALPGPMIDDFFMRYDALLAEGARCHPRRAGPPASRRRVKQTPVVVDTLGLLLAVSVTAANGPANAP